MFYRKGLSLALLLLCLFLPVELNNSYIQETTCIANIDYSTHNVANAIANKFQVGYIDSSKIVSSSKTITKNATFPSHIDLLSIVAIESGFNIYAVSKHNAIGLAQILYKKSSFDIDTNLTDATDLLISLRKSLGSEDAAIQAYNVGIGNYLNGVRAPDYLQKFKKAKKLILAADKQSTKEQHV